VFSEISRTANAVVWFVICSNFLSRVS
jgi:hypothetical protein